MYNLNLNMDHPDQEACLNSALGYSMWFLLVVRVQCKPIQNTVLR